AEMARVAAQADACAIGWRHQAAGGTVRSPQDRRWHSALEAALTETRLNPEMRAVVSVHAIRDTEVRAAIIAPADRQQAASAASDLAAEYGVAILSLHAQQSSLAFWRER